MGSDGESEKCELCMTKLISGRVMLQEGVPDLIGQILIDTRSFPVKNTCSS